MVCIDAGPTQGEKVPGHNEVLDSGLAVAGVAQTVVVGVLCAVGERLRALLGILVTQPSDGTTILCIPSLCGEIPEIFTVG